MCFQHGHNVWGKTLNPSIIWSQILIKCVNIFVFSKFMCFVISTMKVSSPTHSLSFSPCTPISFPFRSMKINFSPRISLQCFSTAYHPTPVWYDTRGFSYSSKKQLNCSLLRLIVRLNLAFFMTTFMTWFALIFTAHFTMNNEMKIAKVIVGLQLMSLQTHSFCQLNADFDKRSYQTHHVFICFNFPYINSAKPSVSCII